MEARDMNRTRRGGRSEHSRTILDEEYGSKLVKKWGRYLGGVKNEHTRKCMAMLYENQLGELRGVTEDTLAVNAGVYTKYVFPVLRRVFPNLIANEIVSVQPMTAPFGAVFFFEYKYAKSKGQVAAGQNMIQTFDKYYSSEFVDREHIATPDGANFGGAGGTLSIVLAWTPVKPLDTTQAVSVVITDCDADGTIQQTATDDGSGGFTFAPSGGSTAGAINYTTGQVAGFKFQNIPAGGAGRAILSSYYYDMEANPLVGEINADIQLLPIKAVSRKLKTRWSAEGADDLRAFQGMDAESELVTGMSNEMGLELDREILMGDLLPAATQSTQTFDFTVPAGITEVDHIRAILTRMTAVSFNILKLTRRKAANWAVCGPSISSRLVQLMTHLMLQPGMDGYEKAPTYSNITSNSGIMKLGPLANKWMLYQDSLFKDDTILMGLQGESYLDAGFVFSPYVALQMTPTFYDPEDQAYRKGMRTRYAKKMLRPEWYGKVTVTGGL